MNNKLFTVFLFSFALVGCTGTQLVVKPDPAAQSTVVTKKYSSVGVHPKPSDLPSYAGAGNLSDGFANAIEESGFAKKVFYPLRSDDKPDITLESQFSARTDLHSGANFIKSFFTGFTLFLLEPVIWYDYDFVVEGTVGVIRNGERIQTISARSDATISAKWLSLSEVAKLEADALSKAKRGLYYQILRDIH